MAHGVVVVRGGEGPLLDTPLVDSTAPKSAAAASEGGIVGRYSLSATGRHQEVVDRVWLGSRSERLRSGGTLESSGRQHQPASTAAHCPKF